MEEMGIDNVVDVPDTPDRLAARPVNGVKFGRECNSSAGGQFRNLDFSDRECLDQPRMRSGLVSEHGRNGRLSLHSRRKPINAAESGSCKNPVVLSPLEDSYPSQRVALFRRPAMLNDFKSEARHSVAAQIMDKGKAVHAKTTALVNDSKPEASHSIVAQHVDKGKAVCGETPSGSPVVIEDNDPRDLSERTEQNHMFDTSCHHGVAKDSRKSQVSTSDSLHDGKAHYRSPINLDVADPVDLTEENDHNRLFDLAFPHGASRDHGVEVSRKGQIPFNSGSSSYRAPFSLRISGNPTKGKEKLDINSTGSHRSDVKQGKGVDISGSPDQKIESQISAFHPSVSSPQVTGHKRLVRNGCISPHNIASRAQNLAINLPGGSSGTEKNQAEITVSDGLPHADIREIIEGCRPKGKGVVIHPSKSRGDDGKIVQTSSSISVNNEANVNSDAGGAELLSGWRSTHNTGRRIDRPLSDMHGRPASRLAARLNQTSETRHVGNKTKSQKREGSTSRNYGESSSIIPDDLDVLFLGSNSQSSSSRSSTIHNPQNQAILDPLYEIDELSPQMRNNYSQRAVFVNNGESEARARQVEADEMLARELQEQLYHEEPMFAGAEIDESIAWALQQESEALPASSNQNPMTFHLGSSSIGHRYRQPRQRSSHNLSNRRRAPVRVPSTRTSHLRTRLVTQPHAALSRNRNHSFASLSRGADFQFPYGMDLDVRLDILEALEEAMGDFGGARMTTNHILRVQRDFNENDYEMLLALDENNHQRGASGNQIDSLPESVVQSDNFEETCAVCLENPSAGETIRHLPCLHKFHKDCIDPWLRRNTSCPVCKSSIT